MARSAFELVSFLHPVDPPGDARQWPSVVNPDEHLIHTVGGRGRAWIGGRWYAMVPGRVHHISPYTEYRIVPDIDRGLEMVNWHYHLRLDRGICRLPAAFDLSEPDASIADLLHLHRLWSGDAAMAELTVLAALGRRVAAYSERHGQFGPQPSDDADMARLQAWLQDDPGAYDPAAWARRLGLSVSQMNRRFRRAYGQAPRDLVGALRLRQAQVQLLHGSRRIAEIAHACGFDDPDYFARWFRRHAGESPRAYRHARTPSARR